MLKIQTRQGNCRSQNKHGITYAEAAKTVRIKNSEKQGRIDKYLGSRGDDTVDRQHSNANEINTEQNKHSEPEYINANNTLTNENSRKPITELNRGEKHIHSVEKTKLASFVQAIGILLLQDDLSKKN